MKWRDTVPSGEESGVYTESPRVGVTPTACPFCKSVDLTTASKAVTVSTYWRCVSCGQIWNVDRLQPEQRPPSWRFR